MTDSVDVAIIGGGQAGLATSWYLKQAGVEHVVLEAERVAETWRTRRWDSFEMPEPFRVKSTELDVDDDGIATVIWTSASPGCVRTSHRSSTV